MKKLTKEEFQDRIEAVNRARKIFGELTENNISRAFTAYQIILAEQERKERITNGDNPYTDKYRDEMNQYVRPRCPDCDSELFFVTAKENTEGIKTILLCSNNKCEVRLDSELSMEDWFNVLEKKK